MARKVAIAVRDDGLLQAGVDPRFGRAAAFVVTDLEGAAPERLENEAVHAAHGAGTGAATSLWRLGVTDVVAGRFGPKANQALDGLGIRAWIAGPGSRVEDVLAGLEAGLLQPGSAVRSS